MVLFQSGSFTLVQPNRIQIKLRHIISLQTIFIVFAVQQIKHLNFGRNRVARKHCAELAEILLDPQRRILSLCLDSTCLGRHGFVTIMNAAANSSYLQYLDVADVSFLPTGDSPKAQSRRKSRKNKRKARNSTDNEDMIRYHRQEAIESIVTLLESPKAPIEHLILGWNQLTTAECQMIGAAAAKRGLITLDLHGNEIENEEMAFIHDMMFVTRLSISQDALAKKSMIPNEIADLIVEWAIDSNQCKYRCFKWRPRISR